jgi:hypothetical protein
MWWIRSFFLSHGSYVFNQPFFSAIMFCFMGNKSAILMFSNTLYLNIPFVFCKQGRLLSVTKCSYFTDWQTVLIRPINIYMGDKLCCCLTHPPSLSLSLSLHISMYLPTYLPTYLSTYLPMSVCLSLLANFPFGCWPKFISRVLQYLKSTGCLEDKLHLFSLLLDLL